LKSKTSPVIGAKKNPRKNFTIILDGGLGSELERQGADLSSQLWSAR
jgi:S-methylmethionine-dependent homocysteine/selenocysteine methylase